MAQRAAVLMLFMSFACGAMLFPSMLFLTPLKHGFVESGGSYDKEKPDEYVRQLVQVMI